MQISGVGTTQQTDDIQNLFSTSSQVLGKDDFLRLLVTQLSHQDPLEPQTNEEFVAQLAQFSALEQAQNMNATLQANAILTQSVNNALSAGLIGKEVRAAGDTLVVGDEGTIKVPITLGADADVTITIKNSNGEVVRTLRVSGLDAGGNDVEWDGRDDSGDRVGSGTYTYSVEAVGTDGADVTADTYFTGIVTGVKFVNGSAVLLIGDYEVPLGSVVQIMQPTTGGS